MLQTQAPMEADSLDPSLRCQQKNILFIYLLVAVWFTVLEKAKFRKKPSLSPVSVHAEHPSAAAQPGMPFHSYHATVVNNAV